VESSRELLNRIRSALRAVLEGKESVIELMLVGLLAGGHILLEDVPGVGKTTLAKALARALSLEFARVQFTPDLLPTDILGTQVLNPKEGSFTFHRGPVFTNVLLADEINRASPRTQSALLEAMNEAQATIDGETHRLPNPFFVIATQNPSDYQGTYPLPEAQLDRFLLRTSIGYPSPEAEVRMLFARQHDDPLETVKPVLDGAQLLELQKAVRSIVVKDDVARYVVRIAERTRTAPDLSTGVSPRGTISMFRAAQARAFVSGRAFVAPSDVQALAGPVLAHRIQATTQARYAGRGTEATLAAIVKSIDIPI
jgi:MoxR-like ATPase